MPTSKIAGLDTLIPVSWIGGKSSPDGKYYGRWGQGIDGEDLAGRAVFEVYRVVNGHAGPKDAVLAVPLGDGMLQGDAWKQGNIPLMTNLMQNPRMAYESTYAPYQYRQAKRLRLAALIRMAVSKEDLLNKLQAVRALVERGATEGERASARVQEQKILDRLKTEFGWEPDPINPSTKGVDLPSFKQKRPPASPAGVDLPNFVKRRPA